MAEPQPDREVQPVRVTAYAWYALFVLVLVYALNFIDRQILSILAEDIKRDLGLEDAQIGFLYGTAFAVFYALFGIPLGRLADSWYRGRLMAIGLALWSSMTALSGFANSFTMLAVARIGVGIGEASASPAAYSIISDYFPKERRATALSIYSSGLYIGGGLSLPIGGLILSRWNLAYPNPADAPLGLVGWQAAFLGVYAVFSWVQSLRHRDPPTYRLIWATPATLILAVAFGGLAFLSYAISFWTPPYVLRTFYPNPTGPGTYLGGLSAAEEVATIIGWTAAVTAAIGVILGGLISDIWRRRDPRGRVFVNMLAVILPAPLIWFIFTTDSLSAFYLIYPLAHLLSSLWVGAAIATLQDLVLPRMRGTAGATYILGTTMVGLALGPYFVGKVADLSQSLSTGIFALYLVAPLILAGLWLGSRHMGEVEAMKVERARAMGEPL